MQFLKVILPANQIPLNSTVTKINGSAVYTLTNTIKIFSEDSGTDRDVKAEEGVLFMIGRDRQITAVSDDKELLWNVSSDELKQWIEEQEVDGN